MARCSHNMRQARASREGQARPCARRVACGGLIVVRAAGAPPARGSGRWLAGDVGWALAARDADGRLGGAALDGDGTLVPGDWLCKAAARSFWSEILAPLTARMMSPFFRPAAWAGLLPEASLAKPLMITP